MNLKMSSAKWRTFCLGFNALTHWGRVTHICIGKLTIIGSDNGLSPGRRQAIDYLNQCWNIVNSKLRNKFQWFLKRNSSIFIQENAFENVVRKMAAILSRPQCDTTACIYFRQPNEPSLVQIILPALERPPAVRNPRFLWKLNSWTWEIFLSRIGHALGGWKMWIGPLFTKWYGVSPQIARVLEGARSRYGVVKFWFEIWHAPPQH